MDCEEVGEWSHLKAEVLEGKDKGPEQCECKGPATTLVLAAQEAN